MREFIEYLCLKYLVHTSKWRVQLFFFQYFSFINFGVVYIWPIYQSLDKKTWFTIPFLFIPKRATLCLKYSIILGEAPTSVCHFFRPSIRRAPYLRNCTSSNHSFWYTRVKWYLQVLFLFVCFCFFFFFFVCFFEI